MAAYVEADLTPVNVAFLDDVTPATLGNAWFTRIQLNEQETLFKMDTGAEVTAISTATHQQLGKPTLHAPDKGQYGPSRRPLQVVGQFLGKFAHKGKLSHHQVFVVQGLKTNLLLGLPAITALQLISARVDVTESESPGMRSSSSSQRCSRV